MLVFSSCRVNSGVPKEPGQSGVLISIDRDFLEQSYGKSVFVDIPHRRPHEWTYMGEYAFEIAGEVSQELFHQQCPAVNSFYDHISYYPSSVTFKH
jgi:hypothetical protein